MQMMVVLVALLAWRTLSVEGKYLTSRVAVEPHHYIFAIAPLIVLYNMYMTSVSHHFYSCYTLPGWPVHSK